MIVQSHSIRGHLYMKPFTNHKKRKADIKLYHFFYKFVKKCSTDISNSDALQYLENLLSYAGQI